MAHVVFVGKDYACWQGAKDCRDAVRRTAAKVRAGTLIICPWGEDGAAYALATGNVDTNNEIKKVDAFPPAKIIDSLGKSKKEFYFIVLNLYKKLRCVVVFIEWILPIQ